MFSFLGKALSAIDVFKLIETENKIKPKIVKDFNIINNN